MSDDVDAGKLLKTWVHSHEEDGEGRIVYRPSNYSFPPARGRSAITLQPGGVAEVTYPGPTDRSTEARGTWSLEGNILNVQAPGWGEAVQIESVGEDILVVRKARGEN